MCDVDFEPCEVWRKTLVRARKPHRCYECELAIPIGRHYVRTFAVSDRSPSVYAVHVECDAIKGFIEREICHPAAKADRKRGDYSPSGTILMGGLGEEIAELNEYSIGTESERSELAAMGWDINKTGVGDVVAWIWDLAKDGYRETAGSA